MRTVVYVLLLISVLNCQGQTKTELEVVQEKITDLLFEKGLIKKDEFQRAIKNRSFVNIQGLYNSIDSENFKDGIYSFSEGTHSVVYFFIYENGRIKILDLSSQIGLAESIKSLLEFSSRRDFCIEIVDDYLSRLIGVHYSINRNLKSRLDVNCEWEKLSNKSSYNFNQLHLVLAEYLLEKGEIKDIEYYLNNSDYLLLEKTGIYYGMPKDNELLDVGIYSFSNIESYSEQKYYLLIFEGGYKILSIDSKEDLFNSINKILIFGEENDYCHKRIIPILQYLIGKHYSKKCMDNFTLALP